MRGDEEERVARLGRPSALPCTRLQQQQQHEEMAQQQQHDSDDSISWEDFIGESIGIFGIACPARVLMQRLFSSPPCVFASWNRMGVGFGCRVLVFVRESARCVYCTTRFVYMESRCNRSARRRVGDLVPRRGSSGAGGVGAHAQGAFICL